MNLTCYRPRQARAGRAGRAVARQSLGPDDEVAGLEKPYRPKPVLDHA